MAGAEVVGVAPLSGEETVQSGQMGVDEVGDMDIVANAGAVRGVVIGAEDWSAPGARPSPRRA